MHLIDALIPLAIGLLLVARPQAFIKKTSPQDEIARRTATIQRIGYVLVGVAVLYAVIATVGS